MDKNANITAVVLCGGLGTRLHSITEDRLPKPMVPVAGRPFLEYLLDDLVRQGVTRAVLATSYQKEIIIDHFGNQYRGLAITYSIENEPLGTGGAIKYAINTAVDSDSDFVLVLNGDTFVEYQLEDMTRRFKNVNTDLVMALKPLENTDRYGRVSVDSNDRITAFEEKRSGSSGTINAGVYLLKKSLMERFPEQEKFSFETDFLEKKLASFHLYASYVSGYFIDIGIPEDYHLANRDFANKSL